MDKLLIDPTEVRQMLGEGRTTFYGPHGSYRDPQFPPPLRRPGRAPQWFHDDIVRFAESLAERYRDSTRPEPAATSQPVLVNPSPIGKRGRGRPRKPRLLAEGT